LFDWGRVADLIRLPWAKVCVVAVAVGLAFAYYTLTPSGPSGTTMRQIALGVFVVATMLAVGEATERALKRRQRRRRLHDLTMPEKMLLLPIIANQSRTGHIELHQQDVASVLVRECILTPLDPVGYRDDWLTYQVEEWAWQYLRTHQDLLNPFLPPFQSTAVFAPLPYTPP
jgi:hypothetical protein